jgi:dipeptidyl aminopeptidase/acylaminoacyl peptidase
MSRSLLVLTALAVVVPARADAPRPAAATAPRWTIDDVIADESATDLQLSPDGRRAVWVKGLPDKDKGERVHHLVLTDLASRHDVPLTRGPDSCGHARWSPDGKRIAFLSARPTPRAKKAAEDEEPKEQVWLIDPAGGEPWPLTEVGRGVLHFAWAGPDALVFLAQEEPTLWEATHKEEKDDTIVVEDEAHEPPARLFRVDVPTRKVTRLTDNPDRIEQFAVSPDGAWAVAVHSRSLRWTYDNRVKPEVWLHDLRSGRRQRVLADPKLNISHLRWAPDGSGFYAVNDHNSLPQFDQAGIPELYFHVLAKGTAARVELGWDRGLATQGANDDAPGFTPTGDGFVALLADGVHNRPARFRRTPEGWRRDWVAGRDAGQVFGIAASADGRTLLYAHSTASTPPQWYAARLDGTRVEAPEPVATLDGHLRELPRARAEVVRWRGALGDEVEGLLYYPHDHRPGQRRPLVVMIHGGPAAADQDAWDDSWAYPVNLVCARGAFVLRPNYHGSSNYGLAWLESITRGRYGEPELEDIERGVDEVVRRGLADGQRLALTGWSNGAILANLLTARTDRYKAACAGAGSVEYVSDWASCEFGDAFDRYYFGAAPLDDPGWYRRRSPFWRLDRVRTPTLIFFGAEDRTVGTQQGWVHYRALQQAGKAPVRFVLFPGEKHSLKKLAHQRRKLSEEMAWLDRHLFGADKPANEALKTDSPLAWALARQAARRDGSHYGVVVKGQLVPETVAFAGLQVGRFEVTRAQFAAFDKGYAVEQGRENYPAGRITFEQAEKYCAWLSALTGQTYRLPTEEEAGQLYDRTEGGENTLDWWAGYAVNPDDAARLREKLAGLRGGAPLLQEAGSFRGVGQGELVFDLGGSLAEWVRGKDGRGVLRGGSADRPPDQRAAGREAALEYRGFRVVRAVQSR